MDRRTQSSSSLSLYHEVIIFLKGGGPKNIITDCIIQKWLQNEAKF